MNQQLVKVKSGPGFVAALDQNGGSTPKALRLYGIEESEYSGDEEMFTKMHEMRTRIMTNQAFTGDKILAAILFENTMDRKVEGKSTALYLWEEKSILPILKVDKGLADEANAVQLMQTIRDLDPLLEWAKANSVFGTKMSSVIKLANQAGIKSIVDQQFEIGKRIIDHGLVPILEPEIDTNSPEKAAAESMLKNQLLSHLDALAKNERVMLKLMLPETPNFYRDCINHPNCLKVVALSGSYSREVANQRLAQNNGMIDSFSRALTEGYRPNNQKKRSPLCSLTPSIPLLPLLRPEVACQGLKEPL